MKQENRSSEVAASVRAVIREILQEPETRETLHRIAELNRAHRMDL